MKIRDNLSSLKKRRMSQLASPAGGLSNRPNRGKAGKYGDNAAKIFAFMRNFQDSCRFSGRTNY
ncbi:MAG: hypothetical protein LBU23_03090 [Planctomycetota bacterium]|nr:hypothetical protein [Planctomycetota bacterium]